MKILDKLLKIKSRNYTKKEKERNIPRLNEDVFEIILNHVIRMEQDRVMKTFGVISNHLCHCEDHYLDCAYSFLHEYLIWNDRRLSDRHIQWPKQLESNSQRLVYHTNVKLFPNYYFDNEIPLHELVLSPEALDPIFQTFKHFGYVVNYNDGMKHGKMSPSEFIQQICNYLIARKLYSRSLAEKVKKVK